MFCQSHNDLIIGFLSSGGRCSDGEPAVFHWGEDLDSFISKGRGKEICGQNNLLTFKINRSPFGSAVRYTAVASSQLP